MKLNSICKKIILLVCVLGCLLSVSFAATCTHTFADAWNSEKHYEACTKCAYTKNEENHNFELADNANKHYEACTVCGYTKNEESQKNNWVTFGVNSVCLWFKERSEIAVVLVYYLICLGDKTIKKQGSPKDVFSSKEFNELF